jgi:hypothetical protein
VFKSNVRTIGTTGVPLTPPVDQTDYRAGFSVIIQHSDTDPIFLGGSNAQEFEVQPGVPFPLNELDPGEVPYVKASNDDVELQELWQGL